MERTLLEQYRPISEQVVQTAREMITKGLAYGVAGNVSARLPENRGLLITPSGKNYSRLTAEELCFVDWQGQVLEGSPRPSSELAIHAAAYQSRPDCRGVVHTHSTFACALAVTRTAIPVFIDELMYVTGGSVKVAEYAFPGSPELARNLVVALENVQAALMANHGVIGLGDDLAEALHVCEVVEKISEVYINALKVGPVFELEDWVIERQRKAFLAKKARQRG